MKRGKALDWGDLAEGASKKGLDDHEDDGEARRLFSRLSAQDLSGNVPPMRWLVRGVWPEGSHGPIAGAKKTLKSYNGLALDVAIASGEDYLGNFSVDKSGPVLVYAGEGGKYPFIRRYQAMCKAYGVDPRDLPIAAAVDVAPLNSSTFKDSLKRDLDELQPVAFHLDSLYNYHPAGIEAQNLYERGHMLAELSALVGDDCAMFVGDHYRKSGSDKLDLDEIAQAGVAQWADSWILQTHRKEPDLENGNFYLGTAFGSRQWGGRNWNIDFSIGTYNYDTGQHEGDISWCVESADGVQGKRGTDWGGLIIGLLTDEPFAHTMTDVLKTISTGHTYKAARAEWEELVSARRIAKNKSGKWGLGDGRLKAVR